MLIPISTRFCARCAITLKLEVARAFVMRRPTAAGRKRSSTAEFHPEFACFAKVYVGALEFNESDIFSRAWRKRKLSGFRQRIEN